MSVRVSARVKVWVRVRVRVRVSVRVRVRVRVRGGVRVGAPVVRLVSGVRLGAPRGHRLVHRPLRRVLLLFQLRSHVLLVAHHKGVGAGRGGPRVRVHRSGRRRERPTIDVHQRE